MELTIERLLHGFAEQLFLVGELQIEPLARHAGSAGYFIHRCLTISIAGKDTDGGLQQCRLARVGGFCFRGLRYVHPDTLDNIVLVCQVSRPSRDSRRLR
jgi:hypothetical protein